MSKLCPIVVPLFPVPCLQPLVAHLPLRSVAWAVLFVVQSVTLAGAQAQTQAQTPGGAATAPAGMVLRSSPLLEEAISQRQEQEGAIYLQGQRLRVRPDLDMVIEGEASILTSRAMDSLALVYPSSAYATAQTSCWCVLRVWPHR